MMVDLPVPSLRGYLPRDAQIFHLSDFCCASQTRHKLTISKCGQGFIVVDVGWTHSGYLKDRSCFVRKYSMELLRPYSQSGLFGRYKNYHDSFAVSTQCVLQKFGQDRVPERHCKYMQKDIRLFACLFFPTATE